MKKLVSYNENFIKNNRICIWNLILSHGNQTFAYAIKGKTDIRLMIRMPGIKEDAYAGVGHWGTG